MPNQTKTKTYKKSNLILKPTNLKNKTKKKYEARIQFY